jgi:hypothetical protein
MNHSVCEKAIPRTQSSSDEKICIPFYRIFVDPQGYVLKHIFI